MIKSPLFFVWEEGVQEVVTGKNSVYMYQGKGKEMCCDLGSITFHFKMLFLWVSKFVIKFLLILDV